MLAASIAQAIAPSWPWRRLLRTALQLLLTVALQLCVIGRDASGNWQLEGTATVASWTKDTAVPVATVSDAPSGTNSTTSLNVTFAGTGVTEYKYKLRVSCRCSLFDSSGYCAAIAVATNSRLAFQAFPKVRPSFASSAATRPVTGRRKLGNGDDWTKDTTAPTATISGEPTGTNNAAVLNVTVAGTDVSHYKFKIRVPSDPACSNATGYSAEVAVATLSHRASSSLMMASLSFALSAGTAMATGKPKLLRPRPAGPMSTPD